MKRVRMRDENCQVRDWLLYGDYLIYECYRNPNSFCTIKILDRKTGLKFEPFTWGFTSEDKDFSTDKILDIKQYKTDSILGPVVHFDMRIRHLDTEER